MNRRSITMFFVIGISLFVPLALAVLTPSFSLIELAIIVVLAVSLLAGGWFAIRRAQQPSNPAPVSPPEAGDDKPARSPDAEAPVFRVGAALAVLLVLSVGIGALYVTGMDQPAITPQTEDTSAMARSINPMGGIALPLIVGIGGGIALIAVLAAVIRARPDEGDASGEEEPGVDWRTMLSPESSDEEDSGIVDWWVSQLKKKDD